MYKVSFLRHALTVLASLLSITVFAQFGKLSGKVIDEKNNPIAGATIKVAGHNPKIITDVEGRYVLTLPEGKMYEIEVSALGFVKKQISEINIAAGKTTDLEILLNTSVGNLESVVVKTTSRKESVNALIQFQKNTNTVAQVVSAEAIKRSPDRNTGEVLKRVPGVSLQEGKYLIVRGLSDRYNQATLNGALMSSTEPDRKTFSFDIFPSSIIENIIINKAATPEMPGEFAGGLVQVNTKDVPEKGFFEINVGSGVNLQVAKNDFYTYKGGKLDFLGLADKDRKLPSGFPNTIGINQTVAAGAEAGRSLNDVWSANKSSMPVNAVLQLNGGFNKSLSASKAFGGVFSLNYNRQARFIDVLRNNYNLERVPQFEYADKQYAINTMAGALANFTFRSGTNKFSWKNTYNINSSDQYAERTGADIISDIKAPIKSGELSFTSNRLYSTQLIGEHILKSAGIRIKWNGNFANLKQDIPDMRRLKYAMDNNGVYYATGGQAYNAGRFYSSLNENIYGGSADAAWSYHLADKQQQVKLGGLYQKKRRTFDSRGLTLSYAGPNTGGKDDLRYLPADQIFDKANYGTNKFYLEDRTTAADSYIGNADLVAGFIQSDNQFGDKARIVWGVRVESFRQNLGGKGLSVSSNSATDILPSLNFTYKLNTRSNLRVSASQTVSRPEFREISPFTFYDFARNGSIVGNTKLQRTKISNGDIRYEMYPRAGELVTVGVFVKYFDKPIEMQYDLGQGSPTYSFWNAKSALNYGAELDLRKRLDFISEKLQEFTFFTNLAYIKSKITIPDGYLGEEERPMQGQSPYVINAGLQYDHELSGTNATILFNVIGRRISQVGNVNVPQMWEHPRPLLDLQVSQRLSQRASLKLSVTDILNKRNIFYWDMDGNKKYQKGSATSGDMLINQLTYGTNMNLQFSYNF
ncbi:TonB-dependent receptor [Filimonas effusa]|uniref:TonB-dependent receptor n=1 Tax=Filimonas effusa TaxID=2508721 RepID=A0A4Q1D4V9_9BACT|nr:TonB-dependent receptor [Filimonas effusa]RXK83495.1 TonB-dependent receptor [Filimonas effusa]